MPETSTLSKSSLWTIPPAWWVGFALVVGVMGAALISPLYALYREAWQLRASDISAIYVLYMAGGLCSLLFLGRLPDRVGFKRVLLVFLALTLLGTLVSMLAWDKSSLIVGRFMVGVSSSLITISGTLGLTALLSRDGQSSPQRVAMLASFLNVFGFGLGPLIGGVLGQWGPQPLLTAYIPTLILGLVGMAAIYKLELPGHAHHAAHGQGVLRWQDCMPRLTWPARAESVAFMLTCSFPFLAFGVFGLYASMAPLFLKQMVSWHGPFVSGTAIAVILLASAAIQMLVSRMRVHRCGRLGMLALVVSNALLIVNLHASSTLIFVAGVALTAIGHGMSMLAGMSMVSRIAGPDNRAGLLSTYQLIGLIGSMLPMMAVGWIADHWGIDWAVTLFALMVMVLGTVLGWAFARHPRMRAVAQE
ncbi:MFS transporter [Comamonas sp.]|uniref:MFS transporter n=1 Tax=Comamonas sp. TaxID=34028 RepID=UPI003A927942